MPSLAGLDPKYTVAAMKAYKSGQRDSELMKSMVAGITDPGMDNIALYYGLQKPARSRPRPPATRRRVRPPPQAAQDATDRMA